jgi:choline dehydrogenase-like flavoprotein
MARPGLGAPDRLTQPDAPQGSVATPWTDRDLATLAALATTFVPGEDGERRAALTADALERAADPSQIAQLRLVLRAMESRIANAALGAGATPFSTMTQEARERYLLDWGRSRIAQRRTVFASLRKLLTFLAYADPGVDGSNPRHVAIGYRPESPPVTPEPTPIVPVALPFDEGDPDEPLMLDADVVVVGSGAGGGVMAAELASEGRSVVVLEAGPFVDERSMPDNELDAFARLYLNHGLLATWDSSLTLLSGSGVGGGTLVNWMTTIEAPAAIREEWRRDHGLDGLDGGGAWSDDIAALERELGVTPTAFVPPKDGAILRGAAALGWEAAPTQRNTLGCDDCGSCGFGCRRGAKQSGIRSHLASAFAAGARVVPRVRVTRVLLEGGRATGVEGLALVPDPVTGEPIPDPTAPGGVRVRRLVVHARQVVVAAGALRTPAVLEASGLGHPAIGRYLQVHPVSGVLARMPTPVEMWRGPMQGARCLEFGDAEPGRHGYAIESAPGHPGLIALAAPWEGAGDHARLMQDVRYLAPMIAVTRDGGTGRTSVTRSGRIRLDYQLDATGVATLRHAVDRISRLARAAGAIELVVPGAASARYVAAPASGARADDATFERYVASLASFDFRPNRGTVLSAHQMGTARMGATPRHHACDPHGRVRVSDRGDQSVRGLYVADASLFPTGIGVNPMLTVMALARRVARTVLAEG